jgi:hypothetical protein
VSKRYGLVWNWGSKRFGYRDRESLFTYFGREAERFDGKEIYEFWKGATVTIMAIAGHVSPKMLAHYSHVLMEAKRKALDGLAATAKGYGTNSGTNALQANEMVGPNGLEPSTSSVSGRRSNQLSYGPITNGATFPTQAIRPQNSNHSQDPDLHRVKVAL